MEGAQRREKTTPDSVEVRKIKGKRDKGKKKPPHTLLLETDKGCKHSSKTSFSRKDSVEFPNKERRF